MNNRDGVSKSKAKRALNKKKEKGKAQIFN